MALGLTLDIGAVIGGDFVVVRPLGQGGMGAVYVAEQASTGKLRALKIMHREMTPDLTLQRRFEQEAKVGALIKSGHVVDVIAAGIDPAAGVPYLVMELLEGIDLRRHMTLSGRLPREEVRSIFEQLCHGVAAAHAVGIVHRDLKPENIFLSRPSRAGTLDSVVKVLDFGIAKLAAEASTRATAAIGSPLWMAPEQTTPGPVTAAADVWALGLIAYELLTGEHFWRSASLPTATPMHLLREIVLDPIPPASGRGGVLLPPGFDRWFDKCVARAPGDRFQDAGALWRAMQDFLPDSSVRDSHRIAVAGGTDPFAATATLPDQRAELASPRSVADTPIVAASATSSGAPTSRMSTSAWLVAAGVGGAGLLAGVVLASSRAPAASVVLASPTVSSLPPPLATVPNVPPVSVPAIPSAPPVPRIAQTSARPSSAEHSPTGQTGGVQGGFSNPHDSARREEDIDGPQVVTVQGRHVRLLTRVVSNASNVIDSTVRSAIDHSAWSYMRCFQETYASSKEVTDGTVTVAFDILDQLPRHAALESSTFPSAMVNSCLVRTLAGQTINAAGSAGAGHVVYAFRFVTD